ncbi:MAG: glycosyltransferase family 2 protein [Cyclobacteriaceae bacterium]|nr:glycosyltransferase family 2 protein [Cyclobacteriaceae bacterium]
MEKISLVITLYNEALNVQPLFEKIRSALGGLTYEVIIVDDGSNDTTLAQARQHADAHTRIVVLKRNFGQTAAMAAGIDYATGDYIITLDGDLQNDPADIPAMLDKLKKENWDVVAGNRKNRKDGALLRKIPSALANRLIRKLTGVTIRDYGCTLKVFRAETAKSLELYGELHRFIPILAVLQGARITNMDVLHHPRIHGQSKYGLGRTLKVLSDLLLLAFFQKYFKRPIHFFGPLGMLCLLAGGAINFYLLILKILGEDIWGRPLLILGVTIVLAGIQFLTFGVIAELMMRTYYESQQKKTYVVKEIITLPRNLLHAS